MRYLKLFFKSIGCLLVLLIVSYLGVAAYIFFNKTSLLDKVKTELNKNIDGVIEIGDIDPSFVLSFPAASIQLENILIKDHHWSKHKHTLLEAQKVYISIDILSLFKGNFIFDNVRVQNGTIDLYIDSSGYSNTRVFVDKSKNKPSGQPNSAGFRKFQLSNVRFVMNNEHSNKLFDFQVENLKGGLHPDKLGWKMKLDVDILIKTLSFNKSKGSFLKNKRLLAQHLFVYDKSKSLLRLIPSKTIIGKNEYEISAQFGLSSSPVKFSIKIKSDELSWHEGATALTPKIASKLLKFDLEKPIKMVAILAGDFGAGGQPSINVKANVINNNLKSPLGNFRNCNFTGTFTNCSSQRLSNSDENSEIKISHFWGLSNNIRVDMDSLLVRDLTNPILHSNIRTNFKMKNLNKVLGEDLLSFSKGRVSLNVQYSAGIQDFQIIKPFIKGFIDVKEADIEYIPRKLKFRNTYVRLRFMDDNLYLDNVRCSSGNSNFLMKGAIMNFMNIYYDSPEQIKLKCDIKSNELHPADFFSLLGAKRDTKRAKSVRNALNQQLFDAIDKAEMDFNLQVEKIVYNKFVARNAYVGILFQPDLITLKNIKVQHEGGTIFANGRIVQKNNLNNFFVSARVNNVNVSKFFYAFDNFGLKSFNHENLKGVLNSKLAITGKIGNTGKLIHRSLNGNLDFRLSNAALLNFPPLQGVAKFAFPFRDLNNITFSDLTGHFDIEGHKVKIRPMQISSSVLNMDISGIYSLDKGTKIRLDIPLRNPKKDSKIVDPNERAQKRMKGIVLHILAEDGEDGKVHFNWLGGS